MPFSLNFCIKKCNPVILFHFYKLILSQSYASINEDIKIESDVNKHSSRDRLSSQAG